MHWRPAPLNRKGAKQLRKLLSQPQFQLLGPWKRDVNSLIDINRRLLKGSFAIIDQFLAAGVWNMVFNDTLKGISQGWMKRSGRPWKKPGVNSAAYRKAESAKARCNFLHNYGFTFGYHVLDPRGRESDLMASDFPGHMQVYRGLSVENWTRILFILLTGQDAIPVNADFEMPYYREYRTGDCALLHNDMDGRNGIRALCFNYWHARWPSS